MRSTRAGFTLIELLVVIAIIAILASILFPVFARARGKARQSACLSNMKQLGLAIIGYASDYDGMTPYWDTNPSQSGSVNHQTWDRAILPYMKNTQILICADNKFNNQGIDVDGVTQSGPKRGYAIANYAQGVDQDAPQSPAGTVLLVEKGAYLPGTKSDAPAEYCDQAGYNQSYPAVPFRHNNGNNFCYIDGHVKWSAGTAGPFAADNCTAAECAVERDAKGFPSNEYYDHARKGHVCFSPDWPKE